MNVDSYIDHYGAQETLERYFPQYKQDPLIAHALKEIELMWLAITARMIKCEEEGVLR